jgi:integrase
MRIKLTPNYIATAAADAGVDRTIFWDTAQPGFGFMITKAGARSYVLQYRSNGSSRRLTISGKLSLKDARKQAKILQGQIATGGDPVLEKRRKAELATGTVRAVAEAYLKREGKQLRTLVLRRSTFERLIFPKFGSRPIADIRRSEIVRLLDQIADDRGPMAAAHTFEALRRLMNWHAARSDDFRSPITRGMWTTQKQPRTRILSEGELRSIWNAADDMPGPFGLFIQFALLTASRRGEAADMRWDEIDGDEWLIPSSRYKNAPSRNYSHLVPLTSAARSVLARLPRLGAFVFSSGDDRPISSFSFLKRQIDVRSGVKNWRLHDLRRTSRSLMSQAGVPPDHAERAIGHVIGGIRGTYDRFAFKVEKRAAFEKLAALIKEIVQSGDRVKR